MAETDCLALLATAMWQTVLAEETIEKHRESLSRRYDFAPYAAVQLLDYTRRGRIDAFDVVRYFRQCGYSCSLSDAKALIHQYDLDLDSRLSEEELGAILLPATNFALKREASTRVRSSALSYDTVRQVRDLMHCELTYHQKLAQIAASLQPHLNVLSLLVRQGLDRQTVKNLLLQQQYPATEVALDSLYRRWSSQSGSLTLQDLPISYSTLQYEDKEELLKIPSPIDPLASSVLSPASEILSFRTSPRNGNPALHSDACVDMLMEQLTALREAENVREELALCSDFTPDAAYMLLFEGKKGPISSDDLTYSLLKTGIHVVKNDSELLLNRYVSGNYLTFPTFSAMISPQREAFRILSSTRPMSLQTHMKVDTELLVFDLLRLMLHVEHRSEVWRQGLRGTGAEEIFGKMDVAGVGYVTAAVVGSM